MSEQIMVVDSAWLNHLIGANTKKLLRVEEDEFIKSVEANSFFMDRSMAETNTDYKQIVSYCLISFDNDYYLTQRTPNQTEKRLHNRFSLGIGGHISINDAGSGDTILCGLNRELLEEVEFDCRYSRSFLGVINDNSSEVNSVHAGICYLIKLEERMCSIREKEKMRGFWINHTELADYAEVMEGWSKILVNTICEVLHGQNRRE